MKESKTYQNIEKALMSESIAIIRYLNFADIAKKEGRVEEAAFFEKMAQNETEHAKVWYKLKENMSMDTAENLQLSAQYENEEWKDIYPKYASIAKQEGFLDIALMFERIASIECDHERKFLEKRLEMLDANSTNEGTETKEEYTCMFCGFVSSEKLDICPVCDAEHGFE